ncbi:hypothetical protein BaRGS_00030150 [Batillaria attramentaria]|uniref:Secreted protein n=1 Tax=Batillaria attramentaria TaxID=370345 RepID=A0ABD0JVN5_9CAEN
MAWTHPYLLLSFWLTGSSQIKCRQNHGSTQNKDILSLLITPVAIHPEYLALKVFNLPLPYLPRLRGWLKSLKREIMTSRQDTNGDQPSAMTRPKAPA